MTQAVSEKKGSPIVPIGGAAAGAVLGGAVIKRKIKAHEVIGSEQDVFEKMKKADGDDEIIKVINDQVEFYKKADEIAGETIDELLGGKPEVTVEEFLGKNADDFANDLAALKDTSLVEAKKAVEEAQEGLKKATDTAKEGLKETLKEKQGLVKKIEEEIIQAERKLSIANLASEDKITKDALKPYFKQEIEGSFTKNIDGLLGKIKGNLPKKFSGKLAVIGAILGLFTGLIINKFSKK